MRLVYTSTFYPPSDLKLRLRDCEMIDGKERRQNVLIHNAVFRVVEFNLKFCCEISVITVIIII